MTEDRKTSAEIQQELDVLTKRLKTVIYDIAVHEQAIKELMGEKYDLDGGGWGVHCTGSIYHCKVRLSSAKLRESDAVALPIQWVDGQSPYGERGYVLDKVTAKQISVRQMGCKMSDKFHLNGKSYHEHRGRIDIRKTFGIDADSVPPNWKQPTKGTK